MGHERQAYHQMSQQKVIKILLKLFTFPPPKSSPVEGAISFSVHPLHDLPPQVIASVLFHTLTLQNTGQQHDSSTVKPLTKSRLQWALPRAGALEAPLSLSPETLRLARRASFLSHCYYTYCSLCLECSSSYSLHYWHIKFCSVLVKFYYKVREGRDFVMCAALPPIPNIASNKWWPVKKKYVE